MRIAVDLDDTICITYNRDYENAIPIHKTIYNLRCAKSEGAYIIIYTARGMLSCNGDVQKAERKNRDIIERWLQKNDVPYDEILFGKPYADAYIDDKAVTLQDWWHHGLSVMSGFSGKAAYHIGNCVVKECKDAERVEQWYKVASKIGKGYYVVPNIYSSKNGTLVMSYEEGDILAECIQKEDIYKIVNIIRRFSDEQKEGVNDINQYMEYVHERGGSEYAEHCNRLLSEMIGFKSLKKKTFSHGDLSLRNIIKKGGNYCLIDPSLKDCSSWVLDAAKLRASLNGLDVAISENGRYLYELVPIFDSLFTEEELREIKITEITHYIRVLYYAKKLHKERSVEILKNNIKRGSELLWY